MRSVIQFIKELETVLKLNPKSKIVYLAGDCEWALSIAVYLLGAYITFSKKPDFHLHILDCW
jgi:hypothetical protein